MWNNSLNSYVFIILLLIFPKRFSRSLNRLENWRRHSTQAARTANPSAVTAPLVGAARYRYSFQTGCPACRLRQRLRPTVDAFETLSQRDWSTPSATSRHRKPSITASKNISKLGRSRDTNQYGLKIMFNTREKRNNYSKVSLDDRIPVVIWQRHCVDFFLRNFGLFMYMSS